MGCFYIVWIFFSIILIFHVIFVSTLLTQNIGIKRIYRKTKKNCYYENNHKSLIKRKVEKNSAYHSHFVLFDNNFNFINQNIRDSSNFLFKSFLVGTFTGIGVVLFKSGDNIIIIIIIT